MSIIRTGRDRTGARSASSRGTVEIQPLFPTSDNVARRDGLGGLVIATSARPADGTLQDLLGVRERLHLVIESNDVNDPAVANREYLKPQARTATLACTLSALHAQAHQQSFT